MRSRDAVMLVLAFSTSTDETEFRNSHTKKKLLNDLLSCNKQEFSFQELFTL